jgi:hypothetical protein
MADYFSGTKALLGDIIRQEREQAAQKQTPQYQAALMQLMELKKEQTYKTLARQMLQNPESWKNKVAPGKENEAMMGLYALMKGGTAGVAERKLGQEEEGIKQYGELERVALQNQGKITDEERLKIQFNNQKELEGIRQKNRIQVRGMSPAINLSPFERARQGTLGRQAANASMAMQGINSIKQDVDSVLGKFKEIPSKYKGPIAGRTVGVMGEAAKSNPSLTTYQDFKQFILANISRQLGGERGVLTDRDIMRIEKALPNLADTDKGAEMKIKEVWDFIDRRVKEKQKIMGMEGVNTPTSEPVIQQEDVDTYFEEEGF